MAARTTHTRALRLARGSAVALALALAMLLTWPGKLVGESDQTSAARQRRMEKIHSWLLSQDGTGMAAALAHRILHESEKNSLDPVLILALIQVESRFDSKAVSPRGAQGLMQVKPVVIAELVEEGRIPAQGKENLHDPLVNVKIGVSYLAHLHEMFGDLEVALTAYNWGPTRIKEKLAANEILPNDYAEKVLKVQRSLELQLAQNEIEEKSGQRRVG